MNVGVGMYMGRRATSGAAFGGNVDDFAIFDEALSPTEVRALSNLGRHELGFNASQAAQLFELFDAGTGQVHVGGVAWHNLGGLGGSPGDVVPGGEGYALILDESGAGVAQVPEPASAVLVFLGFGAVASRVRRRLRVG